MGRHTKAPRLRTRIAVAVGGVVGVVGRGAGPVGRTPASLPGPSSRWTNWYRYVERYSQPVRVICSVGPDHSPLIYDRSSQRSR